MLSKKFSPRSYFTYKSLENVYVKEANQLEQHVELCIRCVRHLLSETIIEMHITASKYLLTIPYKMNKKSKRK